MIEQYLGVETDVVVLSLMGLVAVLIIVMLVNASKQHKMKKAYDQFMMGNDGKSLEETLVYRLDQVDDLMKANATNERNIDALFNRTKFSFQKFGLIKYDALQEMGGKLSFTMCLLNQKNNGYVLNVVHSREGCYSYVKEIIDGNAIVTLAEEEEQALERALDDGGVETDQIGEE